MHMNRTITTLLLGLGLAAVSVAAAPGGGKIKAGGQTGSLDELRSQFPALVTTRPAQQRPATQVLHAPSTPRVNALTRKAGPTAGSELNRAVPTSPRGRKAPARVADTYVPELQGFVAWADSWDPDYPDDDLYSFRAVDPITFSAPMTGGNTYQNANGGGVMIGQKFHYIALSTFFGILPTYYCYDFDEGWTTSWYDLPANDLTCVALDMTYDESDGKTYGIFYTADGTGYELGTIDWQALGEGRPEDARTTIGVVSPRVICLASSPEGQLYGLRANGDLVRISKQDASVQVVGNTGMGDAAYLQSATIDPLNGKMYWAFYCDGYSGLCEIDTETAETSWIADFPDHEEILCLGVKRAKYHDEAPLAVTGLAVDFEGPSTKGFVSFTMPQINTLSAPLTGEAAYTVTGNGIVLATGAAAPGSEVRIEVEAPEEQVEFRVWATANGHDGPEAYLAQWVGYDYPSYLYPVMCTRDGNTFSFDWSGYMPYAQNGGYLRKEDIVYQLVYTIDGEEKFRTTTDGTTWTITAQPGERQQEHMFSIIADNHGKADPYSGTNYRKDIGDVPLPLSDDFCYGYANFWNTERYGDDFSGWGATDTALNIWYSEDLPSDNWILTPSVRLEAGLQYRVALSYLLDDPVGDFAVYLASPAGDPREGTQLFLADVRQPADGRYTPVDLYVTVPESGSYRIGLRAWGDGSEGNNGKVYVDYFRFEEGRSPKVADMPTGFSVTPYQHELKADLSFNAPSTDCEGNPLAAIDKMVITRNEETIAELPGTAPGSKVDYTDTACEGGTLIYAAYAVTSEGLGRPAQQTVFVGMDRPVAVAELTLREEQDKMRLSWEAPTLTEFGDPLLESDLWYNVYRATSWDIYPLAEGIRELHYDDDLDTQSEPHAIQYAVTSNTTGGEAEYTVCHARAVGRTLPLPYADSFDGGFQQPGWWQLTALGQTFYAAQGMSSDGDNSCIVLEGGWYGLEDAWLNTPKLNVAGVENPTLLFDFVGMPGESQIWVYVTTRSQSHQEALHIPFSDFTQTAWQRVKVDLNNYLRPGDDFVVIQIEAYLCGDDQLIVLDNFRVFNSVESDVALTSLSLPATVAENGETQAVVSLANNGSADVRAGRVKLYVDGLEVCDKTLSVLSGYCSQLIALPFTAFPNEKKEVEVYAEFSSINDTDATNNRSETAVLQLRKSEFKAPSALSAVPLDGGISLSWKAPEVEEGGRVTESFESYEPFATSSLGVWQSVDRDHRPTAGINGLSWPGAGSPMGFMVWNLDECQAQPGALDYYKPLRAYGGAQCLASIASPNDGDMRNDWLISPLLSGAAQRVSFMAKTYSELYGLESIEVLASSTDTRTASFKCVESIELPCMWTEVDVELPEGTLYFAIRVVTVDGFMMLLDDLCYEAAPIEVLRYRIYRDGRPQGYTEGAECGFTDMPEAGSHTYHVTAVYTYGESPLSNSATATALSVAGIEGSVKVNGGRGCINVVGAEGREVKVADTAGIVVWSGVAEADLHLPAQAGIWLVAVDGHVSKVTVK